MTPILTLDQVVSACPDLTTAQIADVPAIIDAVTLAIHDRYMKASPAEDLVEWSDVGMNRIVRPRRRPLIRVNRIVADPAAVIRIQNADPAVRFARVAVQSTDAITCSGITLQTVSAGITNAAVPLSTATYHTMAQLATAISAVAGWTATPTTGLEDIPTLEIFPDTGGMSARTSTGCQLWACTRELNEYHVKSAQAEVVLYEYRLEGYRFPDRHWGADQRACLLRLEYRAGNETVPPDAIRGAIVWVRSTLDRTAKPGGLQMEQTDDYRYVVSDATMPAEARLYLDRYRERRIS